MSMKRYGNEPAKDVEVILPSKAPQADPSDHPETVVDTDEDDSQDEAPQGAYPPPEKQPF